MNKNTNKRNDHERLFTSAGSMFTYTWRVAAGFEGIWVGGKNKTYPQPLLRYPNCWSWYNYVDQSRRPYVTLSWWFYALMTLEGTTLAVDYILIWTKGSRDF